MAIIGYNFGFFFLIWSSFSLSIFLLHSVNFLCVFVSSSDQFVLIIVYRIEDYSVFESRNVSCAYQESKFYLKSIIARENLAFNSFTEYAYMNYQQNVFREMPGEISICNVP